MALLRRLLGLESEPYIGGLSNEDIDRLLAGHDEGGTDGEDTRT